jgi:guanylate kinase
VSHKSSGNIFIISAPSGAGKSTLCDALLKHFDNIHYSISSTTRQPRPGEQEGVDYHFLTIEAFEKGIKSGDWAEWAQVHDNYYGTSKKDLNRELTKGKDILMDIDVQGMVQILAHYPDSITVFIEPPSIEELKRRIVSRGGESEYSVALRLENAVKEMAQKEKYRHVITNDRLPDAIEELIQLVRSYSHSGTRC